ncbi:MAG TPA: acyl-CoA-binding protein [Candidatus Competibacteraceae bacterium]|jgi:acyl-CoA-binding protein|nr:MAG: acyl-CoA-binding protein [Candidatus Competibacteraceae bacterium]HNW79751.1 acyl-CoA-binding protein [Candidatus Competibacteraceae bacterium]HQC71709.1 acyl-CoA-binding protein [Candidatus Competibacteraceae bacterium]
MSDLATRFQAAQDDSKKLSKRPDNDTLLSLYAHFKQGSAGDVEGKRPGFTDLVGRAKYDAWAKLKGMPQETAMQAYIDLVESLKGA